MLLSRFSSPKWLRASGGLVPGAEQGGFRGTATGLLQQRTFLQDNYNANAK